MPPFNTLLPLKRTPRHLNPDLRPSRCHLSTSSSNPHPPLPPQTAHAPLSTRRLVSLHGRDAPHFLQGLITRNISASHTTSGFYSAFLNASGRVLHDVFIYPATHSKEYRDGISGGNDGGEAGFLIEVDASEVDALARHLTRFKLRAKVGIRVLEEGEWRVWQIWGENERGSTPEGGIIGCADERAPDMGRRILLPAGRRPDVESEAVTVGGYDVRRIMMGVSEGQGEILKGAALPQESNIDYMGGIDFRKGCYVGQELTIRTHHTGVVRKRILPVQIYGEQDSPPEQLRYDEAMKLALPTRGANVSRIDKKGRSAGKWLGGVGNVGFALCRLEVMTGTVLTGEGSQWSPEHEFKVMWDGEDSGDVRVKAFVPEWHKSRGDKQKLHRSSG